MGPRYSSCKNTLITQIPILQANDSVSFRCDICSGLQNSSIWMIHVQLHVLRNICAKWPIIGDIMSSCQLLDDLSCNEWRKFWYTMLVVFFFIIILYTTSDNHDLVLYWFFEQLRFFSMLGHGTAICCHESCDVKSNMGKCRNSSLIYCMPKV